MGIVGSGTHGDRKVGEQKQSLVTLIPAMNNLIAQQKGVNATQEDARGFARFYLKSTG